MGTRSFIGVECEDGIRAVYCHWDGYPEHVGKILKENYTDFLTVCSLINEGDISTLGPQIGEKHDFDWDRSTSPDNEKYHLNRGLWTTFYSRDRGEDAPYDLLDNLKQFLCKAEHVGAEFVYLYSNGGWTVMRT